MEMHSVSQNIWNSHGCPLIVSKWKGRDLNLDLTLFYSDTVDVFFPEIRDKVWFMGLVNRGECIVFGLQVYNFITQKEIPCDFIELFVDHNTKDTVVQGLTGYKSLSKTTDIHRTNVMGKRIVFDLESFKSEKSDAIVNVYSGNMEMLEFVTCLSHTCHMPYIVGKKIVFPTHVVDDIVVECFGGKRSMSISEILQMYNVKVKVLEAGDQIDFSQVCVTPVSEQMELKHEATFDGFLHKLTSIVQDTSCEIVSLIESSVTLDNLSLRETIDIGRSIDLTNHTSIVKTIDNQVREYLKWPRFCYKLKLTMNGNYMHVAFDTLVYNAFMCNNATPKDSGDHFATLVQDMHICVKDMNRYIVSQFECGISRGQYDIAIPIENRTWINLLHESSVLDVLEDMFIGATKWPNHVVIFTFNGSELHITISVDTVVDDFCVI